ncbi:hypothetical protein JTB14_037733 [Gonioctena quinquepunctata]|nr:hypothetical protein JTB14_037733 [Gonioctena quinquepunctata]
MESSQSKISLHGTPFSELLEPVPGCSKYPSKKGRDKQHSEIFTSTPMKAAMEEKEKKTQDRIEKKEKGEKIQKVTRNIVNENGSVSQVIVEKRKLPEMREKKNRKAKMVRYQPEDQEYSEEENEEINDINEGNLKKIGSYGYNVQESTDFNSQNWICGFFH